MTTFRRSIAGLFAAFVLAAGSACATAHAVPPPDSPPLDMPPPPPRAIETEDTTAPAPVSLPEEPRRSVPTNTRRTPSPTPKPDANANKTEPGKTEPPPVPPEPTKPVEEVPKPPPTVLQTAPAERESEEEQRIRAQLSRAMGYLNRIDYRALNPDARTQYDTAKRFVTQAEDALRAKNLVFARSVADKAFALAAQLSGK